ncbi:hypothetical protein G7Y89_g11151 [Cudoniella acicularis]|uniref:DUF6590 domain-containing protein n=1 Tax=Cudoniella acicularis TaxID=354080 RepID=A0A8H4RBD3_9HELO|nr:hypothetical protein G7Y89_g11151 [Cudoniella acicularis]
MEIATTHGGGPTQVPPVLTSPEDVPFQLPTLNQDTHTTSSNTKSATKRSKARREPNSPYSSTAKEGRKALDDGFQVRRLDHRHFFSPGRVFLTLWTEQFGGASTTPDTSVSVVVFGEKVHSKIRRFIVVRDNDRFCTCLPIVTYVNGSKKTGTNLEDHGIIYAQSPPQQISGITKRPVRVNTAKDTSFKNTSLINYARAYTIEKNVKVKDCGELDPVFTNILCENFRDVFATSGDANSSTSAPENDRTIAERKFLDFSKFAHQLGLHLPAGFCYVESLRTKSSMAAIGELSAWILAVRSLLAHEFCPSNMNCNNGDLETQSDARQLDSRFMIISKPLRFFKPGRVFKVLWTEPAGGTAKDFGTNFYTKVNYNEFVYSKIRRFVVVRERTHSCLCLPLYTYSGQGATKSDIRPQDHALVYDSKQERSKVPAERDMTKDPFAIVVEDPNETIDSMTRMNFAQVYTIQHNVKVAKVGRIAKEHLDRLNNYFIESIIT